MDEKIERRLGRFFNMKPGVYPTELKPIEGEIFRGDWWSVLDLGGRYVLDYLSGELAGGDKQIDISPAEMEQLRSGLVEAQTLIIAHESR